MQGNRGRGNGYNPSNFLYPPHSGDDHLYWVDNQRGDSQWRQPGFLSGHGYGDGVVHGDAQANGNGFGRGHDVAANLTHSSLQGYSDISGSLETYIANEAANSYAISS